MPKITANRLSLEYEDAGARGGPAILLIAGLGRQIISWPDAFVQVFVDAGCRVIRYDSRDVGQSSWLTSEPTISAAEWVAKRRAGIHVPTPYKLTDMADDARGLMEALSIPAIHLVGVSMGGMVAQHLAAGSPDRVLSLTSIMSSSGAPGLPGSSPEIQGWLFGRAPSGATRAELITRSVDFMRLISYQDPGRLDSEFQISVEAAFLRGYNPEGMNRQFLAILSDSGRADLLAKIAAPTLVIHGAADRMVPVACAIDIANRIPGARLKVIERMAHDLPPSQIPGITSLITGHILSTEGRGPRVHLSGKASSS